MMVRLSIAVSLFLLAVGLAVPKAEARRLKLLREHEQWEQLVKKRVDSFKSGRVVAEGVNDETAHIQDIQSYYRETLDSNDGWVDGTGVANAELKMQSTDDEGALNAKSSFRQKTIEGRYIVNLAPGSSDRVLERMTHILEQATAATRQSLRADHIEPFQHVGKGFTATLNKNMVELIRSHPSVANIESDVAIHMKFFDEGEPFNDLHESAEEATSQKEPQISSSEVPWNLDRLDQRSKVLDGLYIPEGTGKGVNVFIVDTGTLYSHRDLEGRAKYFGVDLIDDLTGSNQKGLDCNGHGSHVAGIVGGKKYGVAKEVTIYSVRGLNCVGKGAVSGVVHAFDLIAQFDPSRPKVVSLSLGVEVSRSLNAALERLIRDHGIVAVAAAGNQAGNSCNYSPASSGVAISVGATDSEDDIASFSNTGACVHLFAPGRNILSLSSYCDTCVRPMSGTSMACPHVTGYVAIQLEKQPSLTPAEILRNVIHHATMNAIDLETMSLKETVHDTPNRLLYVPRPAQMVEGANPRD